MKRFLLCIGLVFLLSMGATSGWSHTITMPYEFSMKLEDTEQLRHDDQFDWKGNLALELTNTGTEAWGDFHFQIIYPTNLDVVFVDDISIEMKDSLGVEYTDYSYNITNDGLGLDFLFYDNPVYQDEAVTFVIYTDNTKAEQTWFNISFNPTPVPIPAAAWLLGSGLIGLVGLRRKN